MNKENKQYTQEEIRNMSYWQLWELRRKSGIFYFLFLLGVYSFLLYCFFKVLYILAYGKSLEFKVDLWILPICLSVGPLYYLFHEWYYRNVFLKKEERK